MTRVFVADDHEVVRQGLRRYIEGTDDLRVVGEASDGAAVLEALETVEVDVLLLDLSLPVVSGLEVLRRTRARHPGLPVLVLSMYPEEQFAPRMLQEGAAGFLSKERPLRDVAEALRAVAAGRRLAPPTSAPETDRAPHRTLSSREYQVFMLLVRGRSTNEIARELDLAASTVSNTIGRVKAKLSAGSVAEIVAYALRAGLLS